MSLAKEAMYRNVAMVLRPDVDRNGPNLCKADKGKRMPTRTNDAMLG